MRTLTSAALAGALALSAVAAAATDASADQRRHHPPQQQHYSGPSPGAALAAGALFGFALGALTTPYYGPYYPYYPYPYAYPYPPPPPAPPVPIYYPRASSAHVSWCFNRYGGAYYPATDAWRDIYGNWHRCDAPF